MVTLGCGIWNLYFKKYVYVMWAYSIIIWNHCHKFQKFKDSKKNFGIALNKQALKYDLLPITCLGSIKTTKNVVHDEVNISYEAT